MKVLSLFDGMACGMLAFNRLGIDVERYVAYEIDKYAVKVSTHNFPMIEQRGDVFEADFTEFEGFDWVVGGSPCTYWSIAKNKDRETEAHGIGWELFQQYVRAIREAKPRYFLYENNKSMAPAIREEISETFGFEPICINSALVSAQNRQRLYWVGVRNDDGTYRVANVEQPDDRGILLKDVLDEGWVTDKDKSHAIIGSIARTTHREYFQKNQGQMVMEPVKPLSDREMEYMVRETRDGRNHFDFGLHSDADKPKSACLTANISKGVPYNVLVESVEEEPVRVGLMPYNDGTVKDSQATRVYDVDGKSVSIKANAGGLGAKTGYYAVPMNRESDKTLPVYEVKDGMIGIKDRQYPIRLSDGQYTIRKLTVAECKRLQTIPDEYDMGCISDTQAYKCLGNGWTVEVIVHLITSALRDQV